jgi:putative copper resistance protein D
VAGFLDVLLRGLVLSGQAVAVGGVVFALVLYRPRDPGSPEALARTLGWISLGAAVMAAAQSLAVGLQAWTLGGEPDVAARLLATTYVRACLVKVLAALGLAAGCWRLRQAPDARAGWIALAGLALVLGAAAAWTSHAAARPGHRAGLLVLAAVHQLAASVWIGGLVHLLVLLSRSRRHAGAAVSLPRFSTMLVTAVAMLVAAGLGLTASYVDGAGALLGTAYGAMVLAKVAILCALLLLGAANFLLIRRGAELPEARGRLGRTVEVEVGLGVTALFVAASLTSLPPAIDLTSDRAALAEVIQRFTPKWPSFRSPGIDEMPVESRDAPRTDADRAWSEYNHHVAGVFVLAMGGLAVASGTGRVRWARHWPLIFLGLAAFIVVRADPGAWPLGPVGFWESMTYPEILQHRLFALIVVAFGIFEWMVRTGRLVSPGPALVFPLLCAVGGGLLLAHSHGGIDVKEEFLIEVTHIPLGLLAVAVGWGRWLELRGAPPQARRAGRVWEVSLVLVGLLLVLYRER